MALRDRPPPRPRPFDKLPLELIQLIVDLVHEQDKVFNESGIRRGKPAIVPRPKWLPSGGLNQEWEQDDKAAMAVPIEGKWSCWLGRGIVALSAVDKRFRGLTFLRLCESVTLKQLVQPFFFGELIKRPEIVAVIRHLDLRDKYPDRYIVAALVLPLLPIEQIAVDWRTQILANPEGFSKDYDADATSRAFSAFQQLARRAIAVEAEKLDVDELGWLMHHLDLSIVRDLKITRPELQDERPFTFEEESPELLQYFQQLTSLEKLEVEDAKVIQAYAHQRIPYQIAQSWLRNLVLPSLKSLTLWAGQFPEPVLALVAAIAPNLRALRINHHNDYGLVQVPPILSLRHFHLDTRTEGEVEFPENSQLSTLVVESSPLREFDCASTLPAPSSFPSSLRLLVHRTETAVPPDDADEYRAACTARGVKYQLDWRPDLYTLGEVISEDGYDRRRRGEYGSSLGSLGCGAARDALKWALQMLDRAEAADDERTVHEIVQATMRLRERQVIELQ